MSTDIFGWVEIQDPEDEIWDGVLNAGHFMGQNYPLFAALFGVRDDIGVIPIAAERGLPTNVSDEVKCDIDSWGDSPFWSHTWISWTELGSLVWVDDVKDGVRVKTTFDGKVTIYRDWRLLFELMRQFAEYFGELNVRLVVWFF
jgi:hypothetical protein